MSEVITFNTETSIKDGSYVQEVELFSLVDESDPILKEVMPKFDFENPEVDAIKFSSSLVETCKKRGAFGLSSNQCGFRHRVFVMGSGEEYVAMFNPSILESTNEESMVVEGCLSFPMLALKISRPSKIKVEYYDFSGNRHESEFDGLTSHVFQHELDHLNGVTFDKRAKPMALKMGMKKKDKFKKLVNRFETAKRKLERNET